MKMIRSIPNVPVIHIATAVDYYRDRMHFDCPYQEEGFARLTKDDVEIHLWASNDDSWNERGDFVSKPICSGAETFLAGTSGLRIEVHGVDELYELYKKEGVIYNADTVIQETSWRTREFPALDLHRNLLTFFERV